MEMIHERYVLCEHEHMQNKKVQDEKNEKKNMDD